MRQRWWIAIVAVLGIGLAVLLFPRPDTGDEISSAAAPAPEGEPPALAADDEGGAGSPRTARGQGSRIRAEVDRSKRMVHKPKSVIAERRSRTEVIYASKLVTPFSAIRYTLMKMKDDAEAHALAEELGTVLNGDIRTMRLDPDSMTWDGLQAKTDAAMAKVRESRFASDPTIAKGLERYDQFVAEYHEKKAGEANPDTEPVATPGAAEGGDPPKEDE